MCCVVCNDFLPRAKGCVFTPNVDVIKPVDDCYKRTASKQKLAAIFGVFDGHDGDSASSYCAKGLAPHIMAELDVRCSSTPTQRKSWSFSNDKAMAALDFETTRPAQNGDIELSYIAAFQNAQQRFCNYMDPPRFEEVCNHLPLKTNHWKSYNPINWLGSSTPSRRGGTTACTLSLVSIDCGLRRVALARRKKS